MEVLLSTAAKIAEYTVGQILDHAQYLCCFNNFVGTLPTAKEDLELIQDSIKDRAREATNRTEKIEPPVEKWLKDVEQVFEEVKILQERIFEVRKSYFRGKCQYSLAKEIAIITKKMIQLKENSNFEPFSHITELPSMHYYSSKDFVFFESTKSAYNKLLETLKDKSVRMIGLVGRGGSGKTSLAKEVGKKAEELKLFEKAVIVTVSQTPIIRDIQAQIADKLGVQFPEESDEGRAQRLSQRLKKGTTLLILDDVWGKINFEALGIPLYESNGCEVLLTTRKEQVCNSNKCQSIIKLNLLTGEEAWSLFTLYGNINDDTPNALKFVAREIVNECKGLPIAIVAVGSTLREKSFEEWKLALSRLKDSEPLDYPEALESPFVCLQLSYDNLTNQLAKSLLILCSVFPEDYEIDLEDLFRFGKGWCLSETFGTMEKARREMHVAIDILRDSCLLLHVDNKKVKMHDMVRDVALWIASERGQSILASTAIDPRMLLENENIKDKRVISLWDLKNGHVLDDHLNCPSLEILLLHSPKAGFEVSNAFLESLKMLKTLAFLTFDYSFQGKSYGYEYGYWGPQPQTLSLPKSIELLKNLHTLYLRGYNLGDISILGRLQSLEILDLRGSSFDELPNAIVALKSLKLLDLYKCIIAKRNGYEVIGKCLQLQELYLALQPPEEDFPNNVSLPRLQRYVIIHDPSYDYSYKLEEDRPSRALCINGFNVSAQNFISSPIKDLFLRAEYIDLKHLEGGYKNVIPSMDPQGMNQLIVLILQYCPQIECLFDSTTTNVNMLQAQLVLCSLVTLYLYAMNNLQEVFHDPSSRCSLQNLQEISIRDCDKLYSMSFPKNSRLFSLKKLTIFSCPMLTCLFMPSIAQTLVLLEFLKISKCIELKKVIEEDKEGDVDYVSNQSHTSLMLSKLRHLQIIQCDKLEYIFPVCIAQRIVSLETLEVRNNRKMKYVFGNEKEHQSHHETKIDINLLDLDSISLCSLPNLVGIWPNYCHPRSPNVRLLECKECSTVTTSLVHAVGNHSDMQQDVTAMVKEILCVVAITSNQLCDQMFSLSKFAFLNLCDVGLKGIFQFQIGEINREIYDCEDLSELGKSILDLSYLYLKNLPELKFIWKGPTNFLCLQMLQTIWVYQCPKLTTIFSPTIVRSLPMLIQLRIYDCEEVEQIFDSSDAQQLNSLYTCSQQVCFPKLENIEITKCNKLKCLFYNFMASHFPNLVSLYIEECSQLEKVFAFENELAEYDGQEGTGEDGEQVLLHKLKYIRLKSLPNIQEIHPRFESKDHVKQRIEDCPKYSTNLYLHSEIPSNTQSATDDPDSDQSD